MNGNGKTLTVLGTIAASSLLSFGIALAAPGAAIWSTTDSYKSNAWSEDLLGQVATYQTLAEKGVISGDLDPYLQQMSKVRQAHRSGDRHATYEGVNTFMVMLEARVGGIDSHTADALWDYCYQVTPDDLHARDRHVRAIGAEQVNQYEAFIQNMEDRASMAF
ncbi:MAG: hypothetical protein NW701_18985 [Nitrospira sp.]